MRWVVAATRSGFLFLAAVCVASSQVEKVFPCRWNGKDLNAKAASPISDFIGKLDEAVAKDSVSWVGSNKSPYCFDLTHVKNSSVFSDSGIRIIGERRQFVGETNICVAHGPGSAAVVSYINSDIPVHTRDRIGKAGEHVSAHGIRRLACINAASAASLDTAMEAFMSRACSCPILTSPSVA